MVIIAGGQSRRFGSSKALARLRGQRLIDYAIALAGQFSEKIFLNSSDADLIRQVGLPAIGDAHTGRGPISGITAAFQQASSGWVGFLPCDMPLLPAAVYHLLIREHVRGIPVAAVSHTGLEPLVSLWPSETLHDPVYHQCLQTGEFSPSSILKALGVTEVNMPLHLQDYRPEYFANVNTRDQLLNLEHLATWLD